jgi:hypothetical protein
MARTRNDPAHRRAREAARRAAAAVAQGDAAAFEVAEELLPFLVGRGPVFLAGACGPAAGDESVVAVDDLFGIDR